MKNPCVRWCPDRTPGCNCEKRRAWRFTIEQAREEKARDRIADGEFAWTSFKSPARRFFFKWNGMLQQDMKNKEFRIHPTQKPVQLYAWLFRNFAKEGDRILDTHLGSGSSRIAAWDAGLDFVGVEIDKVYFDLQEQRFEAHAAQSSLFLPED